MRTNESSASQIWHARIIQLRPPRCDPSVKMALGYHRRTLCHRSRILPCEP